MIFKRFFLFFCFLLLRKATLIIIWRVFRRILEIIRNLLRRVAKMARLNAGCITKKGKKILPGV